MISDKILRLLESNDQGDKLLGINYFLREFNEQTLNTLENLKKLYHNLRPYTVYSCSDIQTLKNIQEYNKCVCKIRNKYKETLK